jgi:hypothetical protein
MEGVSLNIRETFLSVRRFLSTVFSPEDSQTRLMHSLKKKKKKQFG